MPDIIINGPEGRIEGKYHHNAEEGAPIALILHPHPQYGGTMNNKIVYNLYHTYVKRGFSTLRFNFRGVGRSQGEFDQGIGELSDAASALDWMQSINENASACWVAGFSFGAWISMQLLMRRPEIDGFISVSAPANMYDFAFLAPCPSSGILLHGTKDDVVPQADVDKLAEKLQSQKGITVDYELIQGAGHFYEDQMKEMIGTASRYLDGRLAAAKAA